MRVKKWRWAKSKHPISLQENPKKSKWLGENKNDKLLPSQTKLYLKKNGRRITNNKVFCSYIKYISLFLAANFLCLLLKLCTSLFLNLSPHFHFSTSIPSIFLFLCAPLPHIELNSRPICQSMATFVFQPTMGLHPGWLPTLSICH